MHLPVAIFADKFEEYQRIFFESISNRLNQNGLSTICFAGRELSSTTNENSLNSAANSVYSLADKGNVSGIIFLSGTLGHEVSTNELNSFASRFSVPKVSLGLHLQDVASVVVDDKTGMRELMEHLLGDPRRQNFAFISGYATDPFSEARKEIFRTTLEKSNTPACSTNYIFGNYDEAMVFQAVTKLLAENPSIDTLVAANDQMALSAVRAVVASGRSVPSDVVVTGFDDTLDSIRAYPAITTVRQPLASMGFVAADLMLQQIFEGESSELVEVKSTLVVRQSSSDCSHARADSILNQDSLLELLGSAMVGCEPPDDVDIADVCSKFYRTVIKQDNSFLNYCSKNLSESMSMDRLQWWLNLCFQIEHQCVPLLETFDGDAGRAAAINQLSKIRQKMWGIVSGHEADSRRIQAIQSNFQLRAASVTDDKSVEIIVRQLVEDLGISEFFMVVFADPSIQTPETANLLIAYPSIESKLNSHNSSESRSFSSCELLPVAMHSELRKGKWLLVPIYAAQHIFGYIVSKVSSVNTEVIESISLSIGISLHNCHLVRELDSKQAALQHANQELQTIATTDSLTGLPNRNSFNTDLESVFSSFQTGGCWAALLFIDLDGFKSINDTLGHSSGDDLLKTLANRMRSLVESTIYSGSRVYRLGGDEFTVIFRQSHNDSDGSNDKLIREFASLLLESLAMPVSLGDINSSLSASIGIAQLTDVVKSGDLWLKCADKAMYEAKIAGKNQISMSNSCRFFVDKAA